VPVCDSDRPTKKNTAAFSSAPSSATGRVNITSDHSPTHREPQATAILKVTAAHTTQRLAPPSELKQEEKEDRDKLAAERNKPLETISSSSSTSTSKSVKDAFEKALQPKKKTAPVKKATKKPQKSTAPKPLTSADLGAPDEGCSDETASATQKPKKKQGELDLDL